MNQTFWQGKRVLITGHTGFKGSWLSLCLQSLGAKVLGYAHKPPTQPNLFNLASVASGITSVLGDVRDREHFGQVVKDFKPEIVFHLAALAIVRESYNKPVETYATNVMGTVHLLDAVRHTENVRAVVIITSDKCYENREWVWGYRENEMMGGYDPYSSSKGCAEIVTAGYRNSFFNPKNHSKHGVALATARAGNVIGGGDWAKDRLIPDILRSLLKEETIIIRNPLAIRPWQHVLEPLNGYMMLAERLYQDGPAYSEGWNFGPYESGVKPVSWVVDELVSLWDTNISWQQDEAYQPHEDTYLTLDCAKARAKLGWKPVLDLNTSLSWTVEWMKAYQAGADMRRMTEIQTNRFMELARPAEIILPALRAQSKEKKAAVWEDRLQLLELIHATVMGRNMKGVIAFWNRGAEKMYGWKKNEAVGRVSHSLLNTQFPKPLQEIELELSQKRLWEGELIHTTKHGKRIIVKSSWVLQIDPHHKSENILEMNTIHKPKRGKGFKSIVISSMGALTSAAEALNGLQCVMQNVLISSMWTLTNVAEVLAV
ncbi:MAG: CDP-glucose 4,6-dehydratase [Chrysiogenales bacterium]